MKKIYQVEYGKLIRDSWEYETLAMCDNKERAEEIMKEAKILRGIKKDSECKYLSIHEIEVNKILF